eukprot:scaffold28486_cov55-Phaeocystis_antarctica.AAC.4
MAAVCRLRSAQRSAQRKPIEANPGAATSAPHDPDRPVSPPACAMPASAPYLPCHHRLVARHHAPFVALARAATTIASHDIAFARHYQHTRTLTAHTRRPCPPAAFVFRLVLRASTALRSSDHTALLDSAASLHPLCTSLRPLALNG